jgi:hypothetical protein
MISSTFANLIATFFPVLDSTSVRVHRDVSLVALLAWPSFFNVWQRGPQSLHSPFVV